MYIIYKEIIDNCVFIKIKYFNKKSIKNSSYTLICYRYVN